MILRISEVDACRQMSVVLAKMLPKANYRGFFSAPGAI
jgi:hypothetical protein